MALYIYEGIGAYYKFIVEYMLKGQCHLMKQTKAEAFLVHDIKRQLYYFESFQGMHNTIFQLS